MAEFKLGRIRFVWKDAWTTGTTYYKDDVVRFGGRTYICTQGHTAAADFYTDVDYSPTRWNQMSDGQAWKGDWSTSTAYKENDLVKYGGNVYICIDGHVSAATSLLGLEDNNSDWQLFAEGFDWKDDWDVSTRYKVNDLVQYGGYTYVCIQHHTSASTVSSGLEADQAKWQAFNDGIEYKETWADAQRYKLNDVVKYGGSLWICTTQHTSSIPFDQTKWSQFVDGVEFESTWNVATEYQPGDIVVYGGNQYISTTFHAGANPYTSSANWTLFSKGFNFIGNWSAVTTYKVGEIVRLNGSTYLATADNTNYEPPNISYWQQLTSGIYWRNEWQNSTAYKAGDAVRYGNNAYICILAHTSADDDSTTLGDAALSPVTDATGTYWNVLTIGSETSILTTKGDLVYYGGAGPTRLPIGREGQILRAGADYPEWTTINEVDFVYFVAPHGTDHPAPVHGKTFDKPWKTIRYACEQVEKGPRNPNAQYLLERNRVFIQKEVTAWIRDQITNNTAPFTSSFDYDEYKCERDVGFIIDRLIWDIGHGGNLKMRAAAQSFVGALGEGPYSAEEEDMTYVTLAAEKEEGIAAYNYMLEVVEAVLNNEAPATEYQNVTDDSTAIAPQYINVHLEIESGVLSTITNLVGIVTTALSDGDSSNIPARDVPQNLIRVATGQYRETLPIIVPAYTCVQGDELRSTNAGPAGSLIDPSDAFYSIKTLDHLTTVISDVVTGASVTPTSGNTETQATAYPVGDTDEAEAVRQLIQVMKHQADFKTRSMISATVTDPTGYDSSYLVGYGKARKLIKENKKFFQEEIIAWLAANYPNSKYQKTLTRRDTGYIIDALVYDLTYGGNALSVQTGLAYYDGDDNTEPQISSSIKGLTLAAITYLKSIVQTVVVNGTVSALQETIPQFRDTAGSAAAQTLVGNNIDDIIEIIDTGPAAVGTTVTLSDPATTDGVSSTTALISAYSTLNSAASTIRSNTIAWIDANYPSLTYDSTKCSRDVGIILKAVGYDFMLNSNFQSIKAGYAYLRPTASEVYTLNQKTITRAAIEYALTLALSNVGGNTTAQSRITASSVIIDDIIYGATTEGEVCSTELRSRDYAALKLEENRDFIKAEVTAYIDSTFSQTATNTTASTDVITVTSTANLVRNTAIKFTGTTFGGITADTTYYVQNIVSGTTFTIGTTRYATTAVTLTTASGSMEVELVYNSALCLRDVDTYIDALKWDLKYTSNYKSFYVARYYANAVLGSLEEDMYYLRDATGVRDQTLEGLTGDLTPVGASGTSRVTAGAYASLDPGWGPADFRTWIITRSPYVQGLTTLGTGAVGQKIDGALHNGGNDSIVSNDFTQVISDGIGAWVTNNGRAELVSVFTYYSHIGYLAENGGRIRGTNGNNSYGDFGSVAEGFDATETPNTAVVDNRFQFEAVVGVANTDGDEFFNFEFDNAGIDYTEATWTLTGGGNNASAEADEFRDNAVYQVRLLDLGDDSSGQFGGEGFLTNSNTAQSGSSTSITLAATDGELSTAYIGMKVVITGGTGVGQYALITTYNAGTKVASVVRESDGVAGWDHMLPGTAIVSPDSSSTYTVEPAVSFTAPTFSSSAISGLPSGTYVDAVYGDTSAVYTSLSGTYSGTGTGATWQVIRNGSKYSVSKVSSGTGYSRLETITILGTSLGGLSTTNDIVITITSVNSVTGAIQDFDYVGYGVGGRFIAVKGSSPTGARSDDGSTWTSMTMPSSQNWTGVAYGLIDDGSSVSKLSKFVAVSSGSAVAAYSSDGISWTASALPASAAWASVTYGEGKFVAIASDSTTVAVSLDGEVWDLTGTLPSTGFVDIAYGQGKFVAVKTGDTGAVAYSIDGTGNWTADDMPASSQWVSVAYGNNIWVAVADDSNSGAISVDGVTWTATTMGAADGSTVAGYQRVRYGQGLFMATTYLAGEAGEGYSYVATSENGLYWISRGVVESVSPGTGGYKVVVFGNPQRTGTWIALQYTSGTYGVKISAGVRARGRAYVAEEKIFVVRITEPGSGYNSAPTMTVTDPNNIYDFPHTVRIGSGVLATPSFTNRGTGYTTGSAEIDTGDGYADNYQSGAFVAVRRITARPVAGSNVVFTHLPGRVFKLVSVTTFLGSFDGSYTAFFQVSPALSVSEAADHLTALNTRIRYSQVRLTGHDFLDIGTGGFSDTNYPGTPTQDPIPANETLEDNGGRVFYTSTDQDGNFRVGDLFAIEQSTGIATLNADAFNISGLQELNLGNVTLGGGSATITEFSTDPFFTANSDNIVPTQRAIKAYIAAQIGGGGAALNVNKITAGNIEISLNQITNINNEPIKMRATFEFQGGVTGLPIAFNYFLS